MPPSRPATWLDAELRFDDRAPGTTRFAAIADAVARLARLRPRLVGVDGHATAAEASLVVVSPGAEARLSVSREDRDRDRTRLRQRARGDGAAPRRNAGEARTTTAFMSRAPAHVVEGVRARAAELEAVAPRLREHLDA